MLAYMGDNMDEFNIKINAYFDKIKGNPELLKNILDNSKSNLAKRIFLLPKTERELEYVDAAFDYFADVFECDFGESDIDYDNNIVVNFYANMIKAYKNNDCDYISKNVSLFYTNDNPKESADFIYNHMKLILEDPDVFLEYVLEKSGFDLDTDCDTFINYFSIVCNLLSTYNDVDNDKLDDLNNEQMDKGTQVLREFHKIYTERKTTKGYSKTLSTYI